MFASFFGNSHHAAGIDPFNMVAPYADPAIMDFLTTHHLRSLNSGKDRANGGFNIDNNAFPQAGGGTYPNTSDFEYAILIALTYYGTDFRRAYVKADNQSVISHCKSPP
jgi:hypothetical protein